MLLTPCLRPAALLAVCLVPLAAAAAQRDVPITELAEPLGASPARGLRVFDLRGVLAATESRRDPAEPLEALLEDRRERVANLATACATFVDPPLGAMDTVQGIGASHLACVGSVEQQAWIRRFLALQAASHEASLSLESCVWKIPPEVYATLELEKGPRALGPEEYERLLARVKESNSDLLFAPRALVFGLSPFTIETASQVAFVRDYEIQRHGEGAEQMVIADPVVDVVRDGLQLRGFLARLDDDRIGLQCDFAMAEIERPIPVVEIRPAELPNPVKIQKPTVHRIEVDATAVARQGHAILFPAPEFRGTHPVVVLRPSVVEPMRGR